MVTVNGADVAGILLAPIAPVSVKGRVVFDDPAAAQSMKASAMRVTAQSLSQDNLLPTGPPPALADDFTLISRLRRVTALRANVTGQLPAAHRSAPAGDSARLGRESIRANSTDITDDGIEVGACPDGCRGRPDKPPGDPGRRGWWRRKIVKDYAVVVFAQDRARWTAAVNRYSAWPARG